MRILCHRGSLVFAFAFVGLSLFAAAPLPTGGQLLERHFEALGGRKAVEGVETIRVKGRAQEGQSAFEFELTIKRPGLVLFTAGHGTEVIVRMGRDVSGKCWRQDPSGVRELAGKDSSEVLGLGFPFHAPSLLGIADSLRDALVEEEKDGERGVFALGRKGVEGPFPRLVFDAQTGFLVRAGTAKISDYRLVGLIRVPFEVATDERTVLRVDGAEINVSIDDGLFARPGQATAFDRAIKSPVTQLNPMGQLGIVRRPEVADFHRGVLKSLPAFDPASASHAQVDLRGYDLRELDLRARGVDLLHADFDHCTRWPERLPDGFDREKVLALGRDPGLGVRLLHAQGITGRGVGIGVIDQTLLVDHVEYRDRLRLYEEIHAPAEAPAQMHGPAVASIAAGRSTGVAPGADLYYIAEQHGVFLPGGKFDWDFAPLAESIERLLEINRTLPLDRRMRVISISVGWSPGQKGYEAAMAAVARATREGVFVVSTALQGTHQLEFHGLGREALKDPNAFESFGPGSWWAGAFLSGQRRFGPGRKLLVPMDARAVASPTGAEHYVYYASGGWSWSVPWIAGLYALGCEVRPDLTPPMFWAEALRTGRSVTLDVGGENFEFGTIVDPVALMAALRAAHGTKAETGSRPSGGVE